MVMTMSQASSGSETYYECQNGFKFETKKSTARCFKQERLSYRSLEACNRKGVKYRSFKLKIDASGKNDICFDSNKPFSKVNFKARPQNSLGKNSAGIYYPFCAKGFKLQIKRGKDTCKRIVPEVIKPPNKKVSL